MSTLRRGPPRTVTVVLMTYAIPALLSGLLCLVPHPAVDRLDPVGEGVWPFQPTPTVVLGFDPPDSAWGSGHRGVDLGGEPGQLVSAALAGKVVWAGRLAGRGVVGVSHGATRTTYEPVRPHVRVGDLIDRGQVIGTLELGGSHCLPTACLHWGWLKGEAYLDPLELVGSMEVRLLPLDGWLGASATLGDYLRERRDPVARGWLSLAGRSYW